MSNGEAYELLLRDRIKLLMQINPHGPRGIHCPEAADAVHDFLDSGIIEPVVAGDGYQYPMSQRLLGSFRTVTEAEIRHLVPRNNRHIVLRGVRSPIPPGLTEHHYFVVAKMHDVYWVVDAYLQLMTENYSQYIEDMGFHHVQRPLRRYDVGVEDTLADLRPVLGPDLD